MWTVIDTHRGATADLLATLSDQDWCQPSLCDGWTVRDVAAHLTLQQVGLVDGLRMALRHGIRDLNRTIREAARAKASAEAAELIGGLRDAIGSRRHNIGLTPRETLIDILVHSQDVAIPLRRVLPLPRLRRARRRPGSGPMRVVGRAGCSVPCRCARFASRRPISPGRSGPSRSLADPSARCCWPSPVAAQEWMG